jgi:hypothetical protein
MDDGDLAAAMRKPAEVASAICYSGYCLEQHGKYIGSSTEDKGDRDGIWSMYGLHDKG